MSTYTVAYIKNGEEYAYDTYMSGATISDIIKELKYELNRYGKSCDEIAIFNVDDEAPAIHYEIVNIHGHYVLVELV